MRKNPNILVLVLYLALGYQNRHLLSCPTFNQESTLLPRTPTTGPERLAQRRGMATGRDTARSGVVAGERGIASQVLCFVCYRRSAGRACARQQLRRRGRQGGVETGQGAAGMWGGDAGRQAAQPGRCPRTLLTSVWCAAPGAALQVPRWRPDLPGRLWPIPDGLVRGTRTAVCMRPKAHLPHTVRLFLTYAVQLAADTWDHECVRAFLGAGQVQRPRGRRVVRSGNFSVHHAAGRICRRVSFLSVPFPAPPPAHTRPARASVQAGMCSRACTPRNLVTAVRARVHADPFCQDHRQPEVEWCESQTISPMYVPP